MILKNSLSICLHGPNKLAALDINAGGCKQQLVLKTDMFSAFYVRIADPNVVAPYREIPVNGI